MKFFARSAFRLIKKQLYSYLDEKGSQGSLFIMMPSLPAQVCLQIGTYLEDYCLETDVASSPLIKIAKELWHTWEQNNHSIVKDAFSKIKSKEWLDTSGSLTKYRNTENESGKLLIILLIGVDKVTDSASLSDFYHCDYETIWSIELKRSFSTWIEEKLTESKIGYEDDHVDHFDEVLKSILDRGFGDLLQISSLLEDINLSSAQDGQDAELILLQNLDRFNLPSFIGFSFTRRRSFASYLDRATSFFSYDAFLEDRKRANALKAIDGFREKYEELFETGELFDPAERPTFENDESFVDAVRNYVETADNVIRQKLYKCDFITIYDRILGFRVKRSTTSPKVKKLSGSPIEVILNGTWQTLKEFKKKALDSGVFAHEALREIRIESNLFKHDLDGIDAKERTENAKLYLFQFLGGVDEYIEKLLQIPRGGLPDEDVKITSRLLHDDLICQATRTAEPYLRFSVEIFGDGVGKVHQQFALRLPEIESYRVADLLFKEVANKINKDSEVSYCLPVFHVPFYEELMLSKDDEEIRRVLLQCIKDEEGICFLNLLEAKGINNHDDSLLKSHNKLAISYEKFIQTAAEGGLHKALLNNWNDLRHAYEQASDIFLKDPAYTKSSFATLLYRAFLVVQRRPVQEGEHWIWEGHEPSAIVTVLHPALLEMLEAHITYLLSAFSSVVLKELKTPGKQSFQNIIWQNYVDLSQIKMPINGLLTGYHSDLHLTTNLQGESLIHRIGEVREAKASLTTRLLLRYDSVEDEDLSDTELFKETRESILVYRILKDYLSLHPHANDGLSIAVYQNRDIQPIVAAVDRFLRDIFRSRERSRNKYMMAVTFFTESGDDAGVSQWVTQWKERGEEAEVKTSLVHYRQTQLSIAHRIVSPDKYHRQFSKLISDGLEVDIFFIKDFIQAGSEGSALENVDEFDVTTRTLKFPVLEKPFCSSKDPGRKLLRARILSNRQFSIVSKHTEIMARLKAPSIAPNSHHVVLGFGDYTPWQEVIDTIHQHVEWVVCIDPNIDERLIELKKKEKEKVREIIGFGSGVGSHGESNYTISTEQFNLSDIRDRLTASIRELYTEWDSDIYNLVAENVLKETRKISGLSLVRATGIGQYIRDFMAYALTRKLLNPNNSVLCDQLISLDAYRHWFDSADSDIRPDLLWLVAKLDENEHIHLDLHLLECKLARKLGSHLDKARRQLENGLRHLIPVFKPRLDLEKLEDERPDQRYWWLQLHRLIASKSEISSRDQTSVLSALEHLSDGIYGITWHAAALTFWTDDDSGEILIVDKWQVEIEGSLIEIGVVSSGSNFVKNICTQSIEYEFPWLETSLSFKANLGGKIIDLSSEKERKESLEDINDTDNNATISQENAKELHKKKQQNNSDTEISTHNIPERIPLGYTLQGRRLIYWEFGHEELSNRHMLIFGTSGMGKTYAIQCLLCELGVKGQNSLIIDYTNGFLPKQLERETTTILDPEQHIIRQSPLPINPFKFQLMDLDGLILPETESTAAKRISSIFQNVYGFGEQQFSILFDAIVKGLEEFKEKMSLDILIDILEGFTSDDSKNKGAARSALSKIKPFVMDKPFLSGTEAWDWDKIFNDHVHRCHIFQLAGLDFNTCRLVAEFVLWDFYAFLQSSGEKNKPKVLVLDEVQNLSHKEGSPLSKYLREGRKFGISLIMATQIMSNLEKDERARIFNAAHKLFFRPSETEMHLYADIASIITNEKPDIWMNRLSSLKKGECYSLGPSLNETTGKLEQKTFKIKIMSLSERLTH